MFRKLVILVTLVAAQLFTHSSYGQDPEFSQFYANPLYLNPAFAGAETCPRLIFNYRNQWPSLSNSFVTYNVSYDQYVEKIAGGIGLLVNTDNAGDGILKTSTASLMYSFRLRAGKFTYINMAVQGTFFQRSLNWGKLQFEDMIDPQLGFVNITNERPPDNESIIAPDFAAGIAMGWKNIIHAGVAVHHLTQPDMAFYNENNSKLPMKITAHAGVNINLQGGSSSFGEEGDPDFYLSPNLLYQQQGPFHQLNAGLYVVRYPLVLGGWFRHNFENPDAFIALIGLTYKALKVGYSYDLTMSKLKGNSGGAHEVSLAWQFNCLEKKRRLKAIKSPGF